MGILIKKKRSVIIKRRTRADGSRQRYFLREDKSVVSPTVALESLLTTLVIDAYEGRDIETFEVSRAFLHAEMSPDKRVIMVVRGEFVELMCKVNKKFRRYVTHTKNGKPVLYLRILHAIYACIDSALLWYNLFRAKLTSMGFKINLYDRSIATKAINNKQCTVTWYVNDVKVLPDDPTVVSEIINLVEEEYGDVKPVRGDNYVYLGMNILITKDQKIMINMKEQILEAIEALGEDVSCKVAIPAARHLMNVSDGTTKLDDVEAELFCNIVAK